jgi:hypothetical protein
MKNIFGRAPASNHMGKLFLGATGAAVTLSLTACYQAGAAVNDEGVGSAQQAVTTSLVSSTLPARLVSSSTNLYWSANVNAIGSPSNIGSSSIYTAAKGNLPGQETLLYRETYNGSDLAQQFTDLAFDANYVYFVASYSILNAGTVESEIKRVPLTGGSADILATGPLGALVRDHGFVSDGATLFYSTSLGIYSLPIGGGVAPTLVTSAFGQDLGLDGTYVYFAAGDTIQRVPKVGGTVSTVITETTAITALFVEKGTHTTVYWGGANDIVKGKTLTVTSPAIITYQAVFSGRQVQSVWFDGTHPLWSDCTTTVSPTGCNINRWVSGNITSVAAGLDSGLDVQGDSTELFAINQELYRYVF